MVSTEDLFQTCAEKGLRAQLSADEYSRVWKAFNLVMLKQIKSRRSVYLKDLFSCRFVIPNTGLEHFVPDFCCRFNETYEGGERHLDGTLMDPASRLVKDLTKHETH
jgi:hypothetical protein